MKITVGKEEKALLKDLKYGDVFYLVGGTNLFVICDPHLTLEKKSTHTYYMCLNSDFEICCSVGNPPIIYIGKMKVEV